MSLIEFKFYSCTGLKLLQNCVQISTANRSQILVGLLLALILLLPTMEHVYALVIQVIIHLL
jgi:hypothetical protein